MAKKKASGKKGKINPAQKGKKKQAPKKRTSRERDTGRRPREAGLVDRRDVDNPPFETVSEKRRPIVDETDAVDTAADEEIDPDIDEVSRDEGGRTEVE